MTKSRSRTMKQKKNLRKGGYPATRNINNRKYSNVRYNSSKSKSKSAKKSRRYHTRGG